MVLYPPLDSKRDVAQSGESDKRGNFERYYQAHGLYVGELTGENIFEKAMK
jgi:hypothetical protein